MTSLHLASEGGHTEVVAILLNHDASVDQVTGVGYTSLHHASTGGHTEVMRHLLAAGASRDIANVNGRTALDLAKMRDHTAAVELLNGWPENLAVDEELPPQANGSLEQAMEQDLNRVEGEVCEDGKWKRWV